MRYLVVERENLRVNSWEKQPVCSAPDCGGGLLLAGGASPNRTDVSLTGVSTVIATELRRSPEQALSRLQGRDDREARYSPLSLGSFIGTILGHGRDIIGTRY